MHWPKPRFGTYNNGGWGDTLEEVQRNRQKVREELGLNGPILPWTQADLDAWNKLVKTIHVRKPPKPKPPGAPLTKTEQKRKLAKEKARAKTEAWLEKHADLVAKYGHTPGKTS